MFSKPTVRLFVILSLITVLVMGGFVLLRYQAMAELISQSQNERSHEAAKRIALSVKPAIWDIYNKEFEPGYAEDVATAIVDSEMATDFIAGIKIFGNFGQLYVGRMKEQGQIVTFDKHRHDPLWQEGEQGEPARLRYAIKSGQVSIGHVEVLFSNQQFMLSLKRSLLIEVTQIIVIGLIFIGSLFLIIRRALLSPLKALEINRKALDSLTEAVFVTDPQGQLLEVNPAYQQMTGFDVCSKEQLYPAIKFSGWPDGHFDKVITSLLTNSDGWSGEVTGFTAAGHKFPGWLSINRVGNKNSTDSFVGILSDITDKKEAESRLLSLAYLDTLTQVPNRHSFISQLDVEISRSKREGGSVGLIYLDLDNFKWVNDRYGHDTGDQLLVAVTKKFKERLRDYDVLYRIGGDEFTVIVTHFKTEDDLASIGRDLARLACQQFNLDGYSVKPGASVGIAIYPRDASAASELITQADSAMYLSKESGRGQVRFYSSELNELRQKQQEIEVRLKQAINQDLLALHYQPKADLSREKIHFRSAEALIRWHDDGKAVFYPDEFIPVAEKSNLICELGYWVIRHACQQIKQWKLMGYNNMSIAINLSPKQLRDEGLFPFIQQQIEQNEILPGELELEITEHAVVEDFLESVSRLNKLKTLGISVTMDDFGTGYSSLNYLKQLPIETMKIDRTFIGRLPGASEDRAIVVAIFAMAQALGLKVVAEGVEELHQLEFLQDQGCHMAQGYYFSPALPADKFVSWMEEKDPLVNKKIDKRVNIKEANKKHGA